MEKENLLLGSFQPHQTTNNNPTWHLRSTLQPSRKMGEVTQPITDDVLYDREELIISIPQIRYNP